METRRGFIGWLASMVAAGAVVAAGTAGTAPRALPRREVDTDDVDPGDVDLDAELDDGDAEAGAPAPWTTTAEEILHQDFVVDWPDAITTVAVAAHQPWWVSGFTLDRLPDLLPVAVPVARHTIAGIPVPLSFVRDDDLRPRRLLATGQVAAVEFEGLSPGRYRWSLRGRPLALNPFVQQQMAQMHLLQVAASGFSRHAGPRTRPICAYCGTTAKAAGAACQNCGALVPTQRTSGRSHGRPG